MDDLPAEKREPLAALHTYEPVPTRKLFPRWESISKFGWIVALGVAAVVAYRYWKMGDGNDVVPVQHFAPASKWTSGAGLNLAPAISHDGKLVAYASDREGSGALAIWMRPFDSGKPVRLTSGDFNETDPDFSPDDRLIVYRSDFDGGGIYVQSIAGGGPPKLIAKSGWKPRFSPDGKWVAFFTQSGSENSTASLGRAEVFIVPTDGGTPRPIQPAFRYARYPIWAPDSRHLLFAGLDAAGVKDWWLSPIDAGEATRTHALEWVNRSLKTVAYPDQWRGDRIFFSGAEALDAHIWELPISASTMQAAAPPRRLSDGQAQEQQIAVGSDGLLLFASMQLSSDIWSLPIDANRATAGGKLERITNDAVRAQLPSIAANGSKLVYFSDKSGARDVWISDPDGKDARAVTSFRQIGYRPLLSPDGTLLVYPSRVNQDCAGIVQQVAAPGRISMLGGCFSTWDWSPDGSSLLTSPAGQSNEVDWMKISSGARKTVLSHATSSFFGPRFSPDGRWVVFAAGATGAQTQVFVARFQASTIRQRDWIPVTQEGGSPAWSPDGNVLYFRSKRDGNLCIWAQKLGPNKSPAGEPIGILHLHSAAFGIGFLNATEFSIAVTKDHLILNLGRSTASLWTMKLPQ